MVHAADGNQGPQGDGRAAEKQKMAATVHLDASTQKVACYIMPFDEKGHAMFDFADEGWKNIPKWAQRLGATDVYIMSHGWNNGPDNACKLYRTYFWQVEEARKKSNSAAPALYLGFYWAQHGTY